MSLLARDITKRFGCPEAGSLTLFDNFSLSFESEKISVILGPSGCGKTTLLNLLAGLISPDRGTLLVNGKPAAQARVSYLFQQPRLLPWLTVEKNLDFVLSPDIPAGERKALIREHLRQVSLEGSLHKYPSELSGGMAQRAAMARAFLFESEALLMDEPFQGLDPPLKFSLISSFREVRARRPRTTLFVTHDIQEALLLGDKIFVFSRPPARVAASLVNPVPPQERLSGHEEFSRLEKELFQALKEGHEAAGFFTPVL
ncbi:MAG: ABC transporter ATP-binding protein [Spirochaetales bacterium]|jgi:NitT/TauT family transport system ATP-binding protein|nr:ABC transporter ATP-binding protein [Spirochaetales bacterium]